MRAAQRKASLPAQPAPARDTGRDATPSTPATEGPLWRLLTRRYAGATSAAAGGDDAPAHVERALTGGGPGRPEGPPAPSGGASGGEALQPRVRAYMEPRLGADLAAVRVHTGSHAAMLARDVGAHAFTLGRDVYFGAGAWQPDSSSGRRLIAHELTHVVQQGAAGAAAPRSEAGAGPRAAAAAAPRAVARIQRDLGVRQIQPDPVTATQGVPDRFFFTENITTFRPTVPAEDAERVRLQAWAAAHTGQHVTLVGRASQEASPSIGIGLANGRIATVQSLLVAGGVIVDGTSVDRTYAQRAVEYRFSRSVEVVLASGAGNACQPVTAAVTATQTQDVADCETAFTAAHGRATSIANAAMARLRPATDPTPSPAPNRTAVLSQHFPGITRARLLPLFQSIVTRLGQVSTATTGHVCNHRCTSPCERAAGAGPGGAIDLCPQFYIQGFRGSSLNPDTRVLLVLHETTHSAIVPGTGPGTSNPRAVSVGIDFAYADTRLFPHLLGEEAVLNDESYVMTMLALARTAGAAPAVRAERAAPPADTRGLATAANNDAAQRAIGLAESWLNYAAFWTPDMYDFISASLTAWDGASTGPLQGLGAKMLELLAPLFQLSHPGVAALDNPPASIAAVQTRVAASGFPTPAVATHATLNDRFRAAGIYDRFNRMHERLGAPLALARAASGDGSWGTATGLPGLGTQVSLADSFFTLAPVEQPRHVIRLMARAMSDVGSTLVEPFVEGADAIHQFRGLAPPRP